MNIHDDLLLMIATLMHRSLIKEGYLIEKIILEELIIKKSIDVYYHDKNNKVNKIENILDVINKSIKEKRNLYIPNVKLTGIKSSGIADTLYISNGKLFLIEYKRGNDFDTEKWDGKLKKFNLLKNLLKSRGFKVEIYFICVSFKSETTEIVEQKCKLNNNDKINIIFLNGKDFCVRFGLEFETIVEKISDRNFSNIISKYFKKYISPENALLLKEDLKNYKF